MSQNPFYLSQEEIDELNKLYQEYSTTISGYRGGSDYYKNDSGWNDLDYNRGFRKRKKHSWTPVLLIFKTVYNCAHCGAKKEEAKGDYCDDEEF